MADEFYFYETCENDRWDLIASKFYGNCYEITPIIEANFHIPISMVLESGVELIIPKKENLTVSENTLWKKE